MFLRKVDGRAYVKINSVLNLKKKYEMERKSVKKRKKSEDITLKKKKKK